MDRKSSIILAAAAVAASRYHTSDVPGEKNTSSSTASYVDATYIGVDRGHGNHAVHTEVVVKVKREPPPKTGIAALPLRMRKRLLQRIRDERKKPRGED